VYRQTGPLTPQVRVVLSGAARGETARETAQRIHLAPVTVEKLRRVAVTRLEARNLYQAIAIAARTGLLDE